VRVAETPITVNPTSISNAAPNIPYSQQFTATGGNGGPYTWDIVSGSIPPLFAFNQATGQLEGTPDALIDGNTYTFTVRATDGDSNTGQRQYTMKVEFDRSKFPFVKNDVLIVWDPASVSGIYGFDVNPANLAVNISARETALGFTPHTVSSYNDLPADLSPYAHIWDVGYDTLIPAPIAARYKTYLQGSGIANNSGAMFFLGENGYFIQRDNSIENFIETDLGGGSITVNDGHYVGQAIIQPEFLLANPNSLVDFNDVANFSSPGTGTPMVVTSGSPAGLNVATVWKTGSLSQATGASVCVILDVNWLDNVFINSIQPNLIDNISIVLNKK
jgi:hypothetical protein